MLRQDIFIAQLKIYATGEHRIYVVSNFMEQEDFIFGQCLDIYATCFLGDVAEKQIICNVYYQRFRSSAFSQLQPLSYRFRTNGVVQLPITLHKFKPLIGTCIGCGIEIRALNFAILKCSSHIISVKLVYWKMAIFKEVKFCTIKHKI